eukprot:TRINITY_DN23825_c0_g4_i1.p1 TRINITY_DN23825_c0_g4~~TRINITY_DN23825_c0_g4_i1.p1  ORF type:complete len:680 (+),score=129.26 TRINITY_DN23825_c0_g4_i1:47-2041(+)
MAAPPDDFEDAVVAILFSRPPFIAGFASRKLQQHLQASCGFNPDALRRELQRLGFLNVAAHVDNPLYRLYARRPPGVATAATTADADIGGDSALAQAELSAERGFIVAFEAPRRLKAQLQERVPWFCDEFVATLAEIAVRYSGWEFDSQLLSSVISAIKAVGWVYSGRDEDLQKLPTTGVYSFRANAMVPQSREQRRSAPSLSSYGQWESTYQMAYECESSMIPLRFSSQRDDAFPTSINGEATTTCVYESVKDRLAGDDFEDAVVALLLSRPPFIAGFASRKLQQHLQASCGFNPSSLRRELQRLGFHDAAAHVDNPYYRLFARRPPGAGATTATADADAGGAGVPAQAVLRAERGFIVAFEAPRQLKAQLQERVPWLCDEVVQWLAEIAVRYAGWEFDSQMLSSVIPAIRDVGWVYSGSNEDLQTLPTTGTYSFSERAMESQSSEQRVSGPSITTIEKLSARVDSESSLIPLHFSSQRDRAFPASINQEALTTSVLESLKDRLAASVALEVDLAIELARKKIQGESMPISANTVRTHIASEGHGSQAHTACARGTSYEIKETITVIKDALSHTSRQVRLTSSRWSKDEQFLVYGLPNGFQVFRALDVSGEERESICRKMFDHSDGLFELCEDGSSYEDGVLTVVLKKVPAKCMKLGRRSTGI